MNPEQMQSREGWKNISARLWAGDLIRRAEARKRAAWERAEAVLLLVIVVALLTIAAIRIW